MNSNSKIFNTFTRELELETISKTLILHQKIEGDVNCIVWDAALVLGKYLEICCEKDEDFLRNRTVLELGSGLGCVGLIAACLGARVVLTDLPAALDLLRFNVDENSHLLEGTVEVNALSWGTKINLDRIPDKIFLADCIYYKESIDALIYTILNQSDFTTEIIVAQEIRDTNKQKENWQYFLNKMEQFYTSQSIPIEDLHEDFSCEEIQVIKFYHK